MRKQVKEFIEKYIEAIENNDFTFLYDRAVNELIDYVGELTFMFHQVGIDPLQYMSKIPSDYYNTYPETTIPSIPSNITQIETEAFFDCAITSIRIPRSVNIILDAAFDYCCDLKTVVVDEGVSYIRNACFVDCGVLEEVHLPASLITLGKRVFSRCYQLKEINYAGTKDRWLKLFDNTLVFRDSAVKVIHCSDGDIDL